MFPSTFIAGVPVHRVRYQSVVKYVDHLFESNKQSQLVTVNPEMILHAQEEDEFFNLLECCSLNTPDGIGVLWAAYYLSQPKHSSKAKQVLQLIHSLFLILIRSPKIQSVLPERVTGSDLLPCLLEASEERDWKFFFLGAEKGVANKAIQNLKSVYPKAEFVGAYAGSPSADEEEEIVELVCQSKANILLVAYGSPDQEFWVKRNLFKLEEVRLAIGVGGTFDFYAGKKKRAPRIFRFIGLEWLWRLIIEPSRFSRIWKATTRFIYLIFREKHSIM